MPELRRNNTNRPDIHTRSFDVRAESVTGDGNTVEAILSTENPVRMWDWESYGYVDEILLASGRTDEDHIPFLDTHDRSSISRVFGHIEGVTTDGERNTVGVIHFDEDDPEAVRALNKYRNKHVRGVSVGYIVTASVRVSAGESLELEGNTYTAPDDRDLVIATKWRLFEVSAAAVQADKGAHARTRGVIASQATDEEQVFAELRSVEPPAPVVNVNINTNGGVTTDSPESDGERTTEPAVDGSNQRSESAMPKSTDATPANDTGQETDSIRSEGISEGRRLEAERRKEITELAGDDVSEEVRDAALNDPECSVEDARTRFYEDLRKQRQERSTPAGTDAPAAHFSGRHERDCTAQTLGIAMAMRLTHGRDIEDTLSRFTVGDDHVRLLERESGAIRQQQDNLLEQAAQFARMHSMDVCREALRIAGQECPVDRGEMIQRAMSTPALSTIFSTAVGAELLANFSNQTDTTQGWCRESDTDNFHPKDRHRRDGGRLSKHRRGGEAEHGTASDRKETIRAHRYSKQMVLDEMDIADDVLGALNDGAMDIGLTTGTLRPDLVYAVLFANAVMSDNIALFHASHGNLGSSGSLSARCSAMSRQKNSQGININLPAKYVITGTAQSDSAYRLISSRETRDGDTDKGVNNPARRRNLTALEEPRFDTGFVDPDSGAEVAAAPNTFFVASSQVAYTLEVMYGLAGRMPSVRTSLLTEGRFGLAWDVKYDIGVKALDHRGLQKDTAAIDQ